MIKLRVWANAKPVGWLGHAAAQYFFQYDLPWIQDAAAFPLAPHFALREEPYTGDAVKTFFAHLLPEGTPLDEVLNQMPFRNANTFELLGEMGADLPGVLAVLPEGQPPNAAQTYSLLSKEVLSARVKARASQNPLLTSNAQTRMSLAGAQDKVGLRYDDLRDVFF